ncbi:MAG: DUF1801 domain-containing protein [Deltaproteobacteria bacterium]|nr:DUF1801 domain-containing protein [Deltaproteobacteria bacterium]
MSATVPESIQPYVAALPAQVQPQFQSLAAALSAGLPNSKAKIWHGGPVWFVADQPCVGLTHGKRGIQLLFWSGQLFDEPRLVATGKFKAAEFVFTATQDVDPPTLQRWLHKATTIVWDYPGELAKLRAAAKA